MLTNDELKKKIESIIRNAKRDFAYCVPEEWAVKVLADALIAEGLKFDVNYSLTAAFDSVQAERERNLEHRLTAAEHRAEVTERTAENLAYKRAKILLNSDSKEAMQQILNAEYAQAEKELQEERKDD